MVNLDGPDRWKYYYRDLQTEKKIRDELVEWHERRKSYLLTENE